MSKGSQQRGCANYDGKQFSCRFSRPSGAGFFTVWPALLSKRFGQAKWHSLISTRTMYLHF
ncbi:hypothetical protein MJL30_20195, partial [Salmonella enterica subsp. enterica serovar Anatum]|nr:hypothetical protein [Salmonella enterica subsp. enterica serovar Anatum]